MKIVIAPDSFKESLSAKKAAEAIQAGFSEHFPNADYICVPLADGGEGTTETLIEACGGRWVNIQVSDPLGNRITAQYGLLDNGSAVIEMAEAAGLHLVETAKRDPRLTSTYGVGELILHALDQGVQHILLGIGGSATNDAGLGMLQALGATFVDNQNKPLGAGGSALQQLKQFDLNGLDNRLSGCRITVICDVDNPLLGDTGASAIYGPQKGATPQMVSELDSALRHFADVVTISGLKDERNAPGTGAAGGLGYALKTFLNADIRTGIDSVIEITQLENKIKNADLVITGEGRMDEQTRFGKVPWGVLRSAHKQQIPVVGLTGCFGKGIDSLTDRNNEMYFLAVFPIIDSLKPLEETLVNAYENLHRTAKNIAAIYKNKD